MDQAMMILSRPAAIMVIGVLASVVLGVLAIRLRSDWQCRRIVKRRLREMCGTKNARHGP
jgi:hypothetical protein